MSSYVHVLSDEATKTEDSAEPRTKKIKVSHAMEQNMWTEDSRNAERMVPLLGDMWRSYRIECRVLGETITRKSAEDIVRTFRHCARRVGKSLDTSLALKILVELNATKGLNRVRFDVGRALLSASSSDGPKDIIRIMNRSLEGHFEKATNHASRTRTDVVLYGFGRIGRLLARLLISSYSENSGPILRAIVVRKKRVPDLLKRAELLLHDTVHGDFTGHVSVDAATNTIVANGCAVKLIYSNGPDQVDYTAYGISDAVVIDNTGIWRDEKGLSLHLKSKGVAKVLLTAPGKGVVNIVQGVNDTVLKGDERIVSAASCSTNAAVPVLKVLHDAFHIESGHIETVHSFTNDQNIIDNFHKKPRRGRSAPMNIVLTSTGAGKAVAKCVPELSGKLTASAIRVPTPDVSILLLNLRFKTSTTREKVNETLRSASLARLSDQIDFVESEEATSSDFVGNSHASIVDGSNTIVKDQQCTAYVWYDNEYGYSCQTFRLLRKLANDAPLDYPALV
eukprot:g2149.t1